jgi:heat shock protein HspQ
MSEAQPDDFFPDALPRFSPGQLVKHRRYGYRGVVVDFDVRCQADEQWYQKNQTQPDREQPWYHVLVDGSTYVTYAAEVNLEPDHEDQPIHHPLVPHLFERFEGGEYERNDTPWPGWDIADSESGSDSESEPGSEED